ncbi:MAG TPA: isoprenylcysteine carboxylmethyltransferase family protein [Nitrospira sp.]|nr:isoprenylcysteine carboxylmethyltransferase family protein [Nitrospira sp.]
MGLKASCCRQQEAFVFVGDVPPEQQRIPMLRVLPRRYWLRLRRPFCVVGRMMALKIPPMALMCLMAGVMWIAARLLPDLEFAVPARTVLAFAVALVALGIVLWAVMQFRRASTTVNPMKPHASSSFVTTGVYAYSRNPMYLGFLLALLAWAIYLSNIAAFLILPGFVLFLNRFQIEPEEAALTALFPREFPEYKHRVRRWI